MGLNSNGPGIALNSEILTGILLVDDEEEFISTLSERLESRNIESSVVFSGEEALAQIEKKIPRVMVLDLKMPGVDGMEVLRRVKRNSSFTEVIILTGHGSDADKELAKELGAFAYYRKPVDINTLTQTLREAYMRSEKMEDGRISDINDL